MENHKNIYVRGKNDCGRNKGNVRGCSLHPKCSHDTEMKFFSHTSHSGMCSVPFSFFFVLTYFVGEFCPKSKKAHQEGSLRNNIKKKKIMTLNCS